jgi:hypothetical protein
MLRSQEESGGAPKQRIRVTKWTLLSAPLLWTPLLIVALKGQLGLDAYAIFSQSWLAANLERSPCIQSLMRDIAGYNLTAAAGFLSSLARFEEESPA